MNALIVSLVLTCGGNPDCPMHKDGAAGAKHADHKHDAAKACTKCGTKDCTCDKAKDAKACTKCGTPDCTCDHAKKTGEVMLRGEKLKGLAAVDLAKLVAAPGDFDGKTVSVEGTVRKACEKKGCWMELAAGNDGPGVRVTFKDYGFFVPLDAAGAKVKLEGLVKVAELTEAKAKHLTAEGATVPKGKDGKFREVQLVAVGLELRR